MAQSNSNRSFRQAILVVSFISIVTLVFVMLQGKEGSFQIINGFHRPWLDEFFRMYTHAGDALLWIPLFLFCVLFKRQWAWTVLWGFLFSTILAQGLKRFIFPEDLRPITYLSETFPIHIMEGIKMNRAYSFPSGHTTTAFTIALLLTLIFPGRINFLLFPLLALLAGWSRVYLAQHFVTDVLGGMLIGMISAIGAWWLGQWQINRASKKRKTLQ